MHIKLIGPEGWCELLEKKLSKIKAEKTIICLNPDKPDIFRQRIAALNDAVESGGSVVVSSFTPLNVLLADPRIGPALEKSTFLWARRISVLEYSSQGLDQ